MSLWDYYKRIKEEISIPLNKNLKMSYNLVYYLFF